MRVSHSRAQTYLTCPRKFKNVYVHERVPRRVNERLSYGTAWHELMEARWKNLPTANLLLPSESITAHAVAVLETTFSMYCDLYPLTERAVEVEVGHVVPVGEDELEVRFDAIVKAHGGTYLVEHKTTSSDISPGSFYWERLHLDQQLSWYWIAAKELGHDLDGVIYDVVRKPALRKSKTETSEGFTRRCQDAIRSEPEKYFRRELVTRSKRDLEAARDNILDMATMIGQGLYPQNPSACFSWGDRCEYHEVCLGVVSLSDDRVFQLREKV